MNKKIELNSEKSSKQDNPFSSRMSVLHVPLMQRALIAQMYVWVASVFIFERGNILVIQTAYYKCRYYNNHDTMVTIATYNATTGLAYMKTKKKYTLMSRSNKTVLILFYMMEDNTY